jgi:plasmid stabilization system protein ParE
MPRGSKAKYTTKQKRQARHIEEGYEHRGVRRKEAARRAWATVNKETGGGKKSGSGRGKLENKSPSRKGGRLGGRAAARRPASARSASARKGAAAARVALAKNREAEPILLAPPSASLTFTRLGHAYLAGSVPRISSILRPALSFSSVALSSAFWPKSPACSLTRM